MAWAGTGVLWTVARRPAAARSASARRMAARAGRRLHLRPDQRQPHRLRQAGQPGRARPRSARRSTRINALPAPPAFLLHTGDLTHLSKAEEFDAADQILKRSRAAGLLRARRARPARRGPGQGLPRALRQGHRAAPAGTASTTRASTSSAWSTSSNLKAGGLGILGAEQLDWLKNDLAGLGREHADRRLRPHPALDGLPEWGWGTEDGAQALGLPQAVRLGHGAERPHPPGDAEGRGQRDLPHRPLDRLPAARARHGALARADEGAGRRAAHAARHRHGRLRPRPARRSPSSTRRWPADRCCRTESYTMETIVAPLPSLRRPRGRPRRHVGGEPAPRDAERRRPSRSMIDNFTFSPQTLTVAPGTTVTWINDDDIPHTVVDHRQERSARRRSTPTTATRSPSRARGLSPISARSTRT